MFVYSLFGIDIPMAEIEKYKASINKGQTEKVANQQVIVEQAVNTIEKKAPEKVALSQDAGNLFTYEYKPKKLIRYGDNFFKNKNGANKLIVPTSANYVLTKGDVLFVNVYNAQKNDIFELLIDKNGNINIPHLGLMQVGNMEFAKVKNRIINTLSKSIPGSQVIVDIQKYSTIQVIITGNVNTPGIYNLSSFSSVKDALMIANGVSEVGSYRDITVIREGKEIYQFDLYQLLHNPKQAKDIFLRSGDIISVNFAKKQVALDGKVKYEAIYELKGDESFLDLMKYSGGFNFDVTKKSIKVTRYDESKTPKTYILSKNNFFSMQPKDGDIVEVFNNFELKEKNYIYVTGKVLDKPMKFTYFDGMKLKDLYNMIPFRSEINENGNRTVLKVFKERIEIKRANKSRDLITVSLDEDFKLEPFDHVEFYNYFDFVEQKYAKISGEVFNPATMQINNQTTINQLIDYAGGLKKSAYFKEFELIRYEVKEDRRNTIIKKYNLQDAINNKMVLQDGDVIRINKIPAWGEYMEVEILGEVKFPGTYQIAKGDKLADIIKRAGGYTKDAFLQGALFSRESLREKENKRVKDSMYKIKQQLAFSSSNGREAGMQERSISDLQALIGLLDKQVSEYVAVGRLTVKLEENLTAFEKSNFNVKLENNDKLVIPAHNETVSVYGEVFSPNSFIFDPHLSSDDYLEKAGGLTKRADDESVYMVYANGEATKVDVDSFWGGKNVPQGSSLIVPMKVNETSNLLLWKEVTQLVYQLAITTVSLNAVGAF